MPRALVASPKEARRDGPFHLRRQECRGARAAREGARLRGKCGMQPGGSGLPRRAPGTTFFAAGHRELWVTGNTAQQFLRPCQPLKAWLASVGSSLSVKHGPTASTGSSRSKAVEQGSSPRRSKPPPPPIFGRPPICREICPPIFAPTTTVIRFRHLSPPPPCALFLRLCHHCGLCRFRVWGQI